MGYIHVLVQTKYGMMKRIRTNDFYVVRRVTDPNYNILMVNTSIPARLKNTPTTIEVATVAPETVGRYKIYPDVEISRMAHIKRINKGSDEKSIEWLPKGERNPVDLYH